MNIILFFVVAVQLIAAVSCFPAFDGTAANDLNEEPLQFDPIHKLEDKRAGFVGMRGKKDYSDGEDESEDDPDAYMQYLIPDHPKRAGFVGMRGKKDNYEDLLRAAAADHKRASSFFGMRGKKGNSGFVGMRGKKSDPQAEAAFWRWLSPYLYENKVRRGSSGFFGMRG